MFIGEILEIGVIEPLVVPEPVPVEADRPEAHPADEPIPA
jgi:hypothetical protein